MGYTPHVSFCCCLFAAAAAAADTSSSLLLLLLLTLQAGVRTAGSVPELFLLLFLLPLVPLFNLLLLCLLRVAWLGLFEVLLLLLPLQSLPDPSFPSKAPRLINKMTSTPLRVLMTCWFYLVVCTFFVLAFVLQLLMYILLLPFMLGMRACRRRVMSFIFESCMGIDPWILTYALYPWPVLYVVKQSLLQVPIAGWALYLAGNVSVKFTREKGGWGTAPGAVKELMQRSAEVLEDGFTLVVFPEGTRSLTGRLQPFKDGFFRFALQHPGCSILPLGIHGNHKLWPMTSRLVDAGTTYVNFGDPIIPHEGMTVEELKEKTHAAVFDLLKASPDFDETHEQPLTQLPPTRGHGL